MTRFVTRLAAILLLLVASSRSMGAITDSLEGVWNLQDNAASTTVVAASGSNGTLAAGNTSTRSVSGPNSAFALALDFQSSNERVDLPTINNLSSATAASYAFWIKFDTLQTGRDFLAFHIDNNNRLTVNADGTDASKIRVLVCNAGANIGTSNSLISTGTWYHIVAVYDGSQSTNATKCVLYLNGSAQSLTFSGTIPTSLPAGLGSTTIKSIAARGSTANFAIDGQMAGVSIWSKALTSAEVTTLFNSGNGRAYPWSTGVPAQAAHYSRMLADP